MYLVKHVNRVLALFICQHLRKKSTDFYQERSLAGLLPFIGHNFKMHVPD